jgi:hypothetical protein
MKAIFNAHNQHNNNNNIAYDNKRRNVTSYYSCDSDDTSSSSTEYIQQVNTQQLDNTHNQSNTTYNQNEYITQYVSNTATYYQNLQMELDNKRNTMLNMNNSVYNNSVYNSGVRSDSPTPSIEVGQESI